MKSPALPSLTGRTAAALTAPVAASSGVEVARHGGMAPRRVTRADDIVVSAASRFPGHPDKLADLIADTITDTLQGRRPGLPHGGAIEAFVSWDLIVVGGAVIGPWWPMRDALDASFWDPYVTPIRELLRQTGHGDSPFTVDPDAIEIRFSSRVACSDFLRGAHGDPGPDEPVLVYGYATDETPELMPLPTLLAHQLSARVAETRRSGTLPWLLPPGQTRVAVRYAGGAPAALDSVELQVQHPPEIDRGQLQDAMAEEVLVPVIPQRLLGKQTRLYVNPTGMCMTGGLFNQCGVSGRSLAVDTYGAHCPLPCVGLSGQGTENVQRSGMLMARHLAKHVVAAGLASRCTVHLSYCAGRSEPEAVLVDTHETGLVLEQRIEQGLREVFPLTPWGIFAHLDLGRPIYRQAATFGYFGREEPELTWERVDRVSALLDAV